MTHNQSNTQARTVGQMRKRAIKHSGLRNPSNVDLARCLLNKFEIANGLKNKAITKRRARKIIRLFNMRIDNGTLASA